MSEFSTISLWVTGTLFPEATLITVCFFLQFKHQPAAQAYQCF